jgi:SAM-dependent methyltransferase
MNPPVESDNRPSKTETPHLGGLDGIEEVVVCPLCQSRQIERLFYARDTLHSMPGEWEIRSCLVCGLMFTSPRPDRATMARYYPEDYQPFRAPFAPIEQRPFMAALKRLARRLLDPKEHVLPKNLAPGRALEVGCGSGRYLTQLAASGWRVEGLEPSVETADRLRRATGLRVTTASLGEASFDSESFDLVVAAMVLEHLHDPLADLRSIHSWIRPGGFLTGSVPNCASWEFRFFGPDWFALQVPTHLFHFTPATLTRFLETAGFEQVRIYHQRNLNNLMIHLGRSLERCGLPGAKMCREYPEKGPSLLRFALRPVAAILAWLGQAGRISFSAHKEITDTNPPQKPRSPRPNT